MDYFICFYGWLFLGQVICNWGYKFQTELIETLNQKAKTIYNPQKGNYKIYNVIKCASNEKC
jgi:hypothetical protein